MGRQLFILLITSAAAVFTLAACDKTQIGYCLGVNSPAVIVTPEDSGTHANLAVGARGAARSGTYVDSLRLVDSTLWGGGQLGTYEVTLERSGYEPWSRIGVQVTHTDPCGMPVSVHVTALLQPSP